MSFLKRPRPVEPVSGQESVWDYPRPPRLEPVRARLRVVLGGVTLADTTRGFRVLETSHPPNYYLPISDVDDGALAPEPGSSHCEWKGQARYYTVRAGGRVVPHGAWGYAHPPAEYAALADTVAFYAGRMDACFVDDERVTPQAGEFYGGWITSDVVGPFKGEPGSSWW